MKLFRFAFSSYPRLCTLSLQPLSPLYYLVFKSNFYLMDVNACRLIQIAKFATIKN